MGNEVHAFEVSLARLAKHLSKAYYLVGTCTVKHPISDVVLRKLVDVQFHRLTSSGAVRLSNADLVAQFDDNRVVISVALDFTTHYQYSEPKTQRGEVPFGGNKGELETLGGELGTLIGLLYGAMRDENLRLGGLPYIAGVDPAIIDEDLD